MPAITTNSNRFSLGARSMKCSYDAFRGTAHQPDTRALGEDDGAQAVDRLGHLVVDDDVLVLRELRDLAAGDVEPAPDLLLAVLGSPAQALLEDRCRRRQHEDTDRLDAARPHLAGALHVDDQHHVLAPRQAGHGTGG